MPRDVRVRFAPSPTGHLHVGGARTALFNWLFAKHEGGVLVLRIEDTDIERSSSWSEEAVLGDLRWLGLEWDEGPDVGGDFGPYRQSERRKLYSDIAGKLLEEGKAFRCYCTDEELESKRKVALAGGLVPQYDGICRGLTEAQMAEQEARGRRPTTRFLGPQEDIVVEDLIRGTVRFPKGMLGDFIILRSDGRPTYNFACAVDDSMMGISHVIRAEEHLPNTMRQVLVYQSLGTGLPAFAHVSLIVGSDRSKLSKRRGATSIAEFREQGYLPDALINYLALLGWSTGDEREILSRDELVKEFDLSRVSPRPAAFDQDKLTWMNANYIRATSPSELEELARPFAEAAGIPGSDPDRFAGIVELARENLRTLSDLPHEVAFFFDSMFEMEDDATAWIGGDENRDVLRAVRRELEAATDPMSQDQFDSLMKRSGKTAGVSGKRLYMPMRAALTGRTHGAALGRIVTILGRRASVSRLDSALGEAGGASEKAGSR